MGKADRVYTERINEILRAANHEGITLLQMMDRDLEDAWLKHMDKPGDVLRGRIRGLAQAIATVRSPYSRQDLGADSTAWAKVIRQTEDEALQRARARRRRGE